MRALEVRGTPAPHQVIARLAEEVRARGGRRLENRRRGDAAGGRAVVAAVGVGVGAARREAVGELALHLEGGLIRPRVRVVDEHEDVVEAAVDPLVCEPEAAVGAELLGRRKHRASAAVRAELLVQDVRVHVVVVVRRARVLEVDARAPVVGDAAVVADVRLERERHLGVRADDVDVWREREPSSARDLIARLERRPLPAQDLDHHLLRLGVVEAARAAHGGLTLPRVQQRVGPEHRRNAAVEEARAAAQHRAAVAVHVVGEAHARGDVVAVDGEVPRIEAERVLHALHRLGLVREEPDVVAEPQVEQQLVVHLPVVLRVERELQDVVDRARVLPVQAGARDRVVVGDPLFEVLQPLEVEVPELVEEEEVVDVEVAVVRAELEGVGAALHDQIVHQLDRVLIERVRQYRVVEDLGVREPRAGTAPALRRREVAVDEDVGLRDRAERRPRACLRRVLEPEVVEHGRRQDRLQVDHERIGAVLEDPAVADRLVGADAVVQVLQVREVVPDRQRVVVVQPPVDASEQRDLIVGLGHLLELGGGVVDAVHGLQDVDQAGQRVRVDPGGYAPLQREDRVRPVLHIHRHEEVRLVPRNRSGEEAAELVRRELARLPAQEVVPGQ